MRYDTHLEETMEQHEPEPLITAAGDEGDASKGAKGDRAQAYGVDWMLVRKNPDGTPRIVACIVGGIRLQLYRHIAYPDRWVAYSATYLSDVVLRATELAQAQGEALACLRGKLATARAEDDGRGRSLEPC